MKYYFLDPKLIHFMKLKRETWKGLAFELVAQKTIASNSHFFLWLHRLQKAELIAFTVPHGSINPSSALAS